MLRKGLAEKATFELRSECQEGPSIKYSWVEYSALRNSEYTSPKVEVFLAYARKRKKAEHKE